MSTYYNENIDINTLLSVTCLPILKIDRVNEKLPIDLKKPHITLGVIQVTLKKKMGIYEAPEMILGKSNMYHKNIAKEYMFKQFA